MIRRRVAARQAFAATVTTLAENEVQVIISTSMRGRDGDIWVPTGCQLDNYRKNPIVLFQHLPEEPVGTASNVRASSSGVTATITFAPAGVSQTADKVRGLVKSGVLCGISAGMLPIETEAIDPSKPRAGTRVTAWELLEISFVAVPADVSAGVTMRALSTAQQADWQRRQATLAALRAGPSLTLPQRRAAAEPERHGTATRDRALRELMPKPPVYAGNPALHAREMHDYLADRTLGVSRRV